jgi:hypothetical protein
MIEFVVRAGMYLKSFIMSEWSGFVVVDGKNPNRSLCLDDWASPGSVCITLPRHMDDEWNEMSQGCIHITAIQDSISRTLRPRPKCLLLFE